ncbi:uncharacterized protein LOC110442219 [Mizuhopecten yessoensis]|uniref:G-protein coupled receptors family 1 profile domain-containing protein n=1 Tax=Mizuhopecten yessoensis TaxID=6573 RepID=A0A210PHP9_MIZYE|nr:uncharacterized protein LOC110442219 [Mizuhopecten yessoensis]OWF36019.1 hypothetical protein KP79_PYT10155 [Mizuhopecten yessoensis]
MAGVKDTMVNTTPTTLSSGYDLKVYGLDNGQFLYIHIPALTCITISFVCAVLILVDSFRLQTFRSFFTWTKSERFVVYLAVCDGLFNIAHSMDHLHILITRDHVYPVELCKFYGFMLAEFITAQNLMVNIVAINAFVLIYYRKNICFGRYDWKLLLWTYGAPFVGATIAGIADQLGPNGAFCYFDGVKGEITNVFFTTVPLLLVLVVNIVLYVFTWYRIHTEAKRLKNVIGKEATTVRASHKVARTMSLFVTAFFAQWWAMALYGVWQLSADIPQALFQFVTTFSNVGGILNGFVYVIIRRRKMKGYYEKEKTKESKSKLDSGNGPSIDRTLDTVDLDSKV